MQPERLRLPGVGVSLLVALIASTPWTLLGAQGLPEGSRLGGFVDVYYAWVSLDPGRWTGSTPPSRPGTRNSMSICAHLDVRVERGPVRGRLALQAGTSVQPNYAAEPRLGSVSGPDLSRHIQEAVVGVRVAAPLWVDAGVFFSHIAQESWISRDNPTYTRSLIADYTPRTTRPACERCGRRVPR